MAKFVVRVLVLGECVWGDNDTEADTAQEARKIGEREFLTPFTAYDTLDETSAQAMRRMEERAAELRAMPYTVTATRSRAQVRA